MKPLVVKKKITSRTYDKFCLPLRDILRRTSVLKSRGDRPLQMTFEHQLNALIRQGKRMTSVISSEKYEVSTCFFAELCFLPQK